MSKPVQFDRTSATVLGLPVHFRRLRDCEREPDVKFKQGPKPDLSPFVYLGVVLHNDGTIEPTLWKENGRWREDESAHPHDLAHAAD